MVTQNQGTSNSYSPRTGQPYTYAPLYHQAGWRGILPIVGKDQHLPEGFTGYEGADPAPNQIAEWMSWRSDDNVCLRLPRGVIGIDCDDYREGRASDTLALLRLSGVGLIDAAWWKSTARDTTADPVSGIYLFRVPEHFIARTSFHAGGQDSGIEVIQWFHRYMVVAPSLHPDTGREYCWYYRSEQGQWQASSRPPSIAELPVLSDSAILNILEGDVSGSRSFSNREQSRFGHGTRDVPATDGDGNRVDPDQLLASGIPIGNQNNELFRFLSYLRGRGAHELEMTTLGWDVISRSPQDPDRGPWTRDEVVRMVRRVRETYPPGQTIDPETLELNNRIYAQLTGQLVEQTADPIQPNNLGEPSTNGHHPASKTPDLNTLVNQDGQQKHRIIEALKFLDARKEAQRLYAASLQRREPLASARRQFAAFGTKPREEIKYVIDGLLGPDHIITFTGKYKSGKTTFALNLIHCLADGLPFLGRTTHLPADARIGFVNGEMTEYDLEGYVLPMGTRHRERVTWWDLRDGSLPLLDDPIADEFVQELQDEQIKVLVIDSLRRLLTWSGLKENDNDDVDKIDARIKEIKRRAGLSAIVILAHFGRVVIEGEEHVGGASALDQNVDVMWYLLNEGNGRYFKAMGRNIDPWFGDREREILFDRSTNIITLGEGDRKAQRQQDRLDLIVRIVTESPGLNWTQLKDAVTETGEVASPNLISGLITRALREDLIHQKQGARNAKFHFPGPDPLLQQTREWVQNTHDNS
jgi:AAA domain/Bifunctional DNA primase/polymerase, N-terminal